MIAVCALRLPCQRRGFPVAPNKVQIRFLEWTPACIADSQIHLEELPDVMTERRDERGVLPARFVVGTLEAIYGSVWPPFRNGRAGKLL